MVSVHRVYWVAAVGGAKKIEEKMELRSQSTLNPAASNATPAQTPSPVSGYESMPMSVL